MKDLQNLEEQVRSMKTQLSDFKADSWVTAIEFATKILLVKNYLNHDIDEDKLAAAKAKVDEFEEFLDNLEKLKRKQTWLSRDLNKLIAPKLFGKKKFELEKEQFETEIQDTKRQIAELNDTVAIKKSEFEGAKSVISKHEEIKKTLEEQYQQDEQIFNQEKGVLIKSEIEKFLDLDKIGETIEWARFKDDLITFLRDDPTNTLFPKIGWSTAAILSFIIDGFTLEWFCNEAGNVRVGDKDIPLERALTDFLWEYVHGVEADNVIYLYLRAKAYYLRLFFLESVEQIHNLLLADDYTGKAKVLAKMVFIPKAKDELQPYFDEMYNAIEICNKNSPPPYVTERILKLEEGAENLYGPIIEIMQES